MLQFSGGDVRRGWVGMAGLLGGAGRDEGGSRQICWRWFKSWRVTFEPLQQHATVISQIILLSFFCVFGPAEILSLLCHMLIDVLNYFVCCKITEHFSVCKCVLNRTHNTPKWILAMVPRLIWLQIMQRCVWVNGVCVTLKWTGSWVCSCFSLGEHWDKHPYNDVVWTA